LLLLLLHLLLLRLLLRLWRRCLLLHLLLLLRLRHLLLLLERHLLWLLRHLLLWLLLLHVLRWWRWGRTTRSREHLRRRPLSLSSSLQAEEENIKQQHQGAEQHAYSSGSVGAPVDCCCERISGAESTHFVFVSYIVRHDSWSAADMMYTCRQNSTLERQQHITEQQGFELTCCAAVASRRKRSTSRSAGMDHEL
jgi:hypothetical protein